MKVTFKELMGMLQQFQKAATSTRDKCQNNQEAGYDARRANDVAHANGRLTAIAVMLEKLAKLQADMGTADDIDAKMFLDSFAAEAEQSLKLFVMPDSGDYFTLWGQHEAYGDVTSSIQSWEHVPAP